ncbi:MAG: MarR family transcriptional regulator [Verrucomicrobia bacterium]|nr:MarR family transcriptional regulator [Verrucomicrobiota bacterium]
MQSDADLGRLTNAIVTTGNALLREAGRLFKPHGITAVQFNVLMLLADEADGLRPSALTEAMVVEASSTTYVLDRMEALGWLKRVADEADRRAMRIVLTKSGRNLYARVAPLYVAALRGMLASLDPKTVAPLADTLAGVQAAAHDAVDRVLTAAAAKKPARRKA